MTAVLSLSLSLVPFYFLSVSIILYHSQSFISFSSLQSCFLVSGEHLLSGKVLEQLKQSVKLGLQIGIFTVFNHVQTLDVPLSWPH